MSTAAAAAAAGPSASPSSPVSVAAGGGTGDLGDGLGDGLNEDQYPDEADAYASDASADAASSDSDYVPGASYTDRARKSKRRRRSHTADAEPSGASESEDDGGGGDELDDGDDGEGQRQEETNARSKTREATRQWTDDGSVAAYEQRLLEFERQREEDERLDVESFYRRPATRGTGGEGGGDGKEEEGEEKEEEEEEELRAYGPSDVVETTSGLLVPAFVRAHLLPHQREALEWLHGLHERNTGGILGDEMGLGKTVQVVAFLGALHGARRLRTALLLCPASVLLQWVREFHKWSPRLRVVLLHASGAGVSQAGRSYRQLVAEVVAAPAGGVVVTTYENARQSQELLLAADWDYAVLDEGHRIRNPDAEITLACKQLRTVHRLVLTGTPIQNRLRELWSLFDFVYPGKLGTLPTFEDEFVLPIRAGGYANASHMQVLMAYKCALALRDLIGPFLLRRTKQQVRSVTRMPDKKEQVLFCALSDRQRALYQRFLSSPEVARVLRRELRPFRAITVLRHICNHPDLLETMGDDRPALQVDGRKGGTADAEGGDEEEEEFGDPAHSGKMLVLVKVLALWKAQGHRVLLFAQTRRMLDILQRLMARLGYAHCRLDGNTGVRARQALLDAFNAEGSAVFVFLLTTRAGGIGVNLTGADRVLIFDPDWNPSTDLQARERSWRLGQRRPVTVYRLLTAGTIEEKIYHRQIFKQYLTSKVLHDAKRKRCFNRHSLRDLFVLGDDAAAAGVETNELFLAGDVQRPSDEHEHEHSGSRGRVPSSRANGRGDDDEASGDNDAVLRELFDGGALRGAFDHDAVEADGVQNQEAALVDAEASRVAGAALGALRASCRLVREQRASAFTPTWTGRRGAAGDPARPRFAGRLARGRRPAPAAPALAAPALAPLTPVAAATPPVPRHSTVGAALLRTQRAPTAQLSARPARSSRELLTAIQRRRDGLSSAAAPSSGPSPRGYMPAGELARQLRAFLAPSHSDPSRRDGATTAQVLEAFGAVVAPADKLVFRKLLRDMAECRDRRWRLRPAYRDA